MNQRYYSEEGDGIVDDDAENSYGVEYDDIITCKFI